jgi:hypothetical protein
MSGELEEEIINFIKSAKEKVRVFREGQNKIRIDVDDQTKRIPYDEELMKKLQEVAQEVKESIRASKGKTAVTGMSDTSLFTVQVRGRKPLVEQLMDKLAWLQGAMLDIGSEAFIAVLMASGENPDRIPEIIQGFGDRDKFVNYVLEKLYNFISMAKAYPEVQSIKEQLWDREVRLSILEDKVDDLFNLYTKVVEEMKKLRKRYEIAIALMDEEQRHRLNKILMATELISQSGESGNGGGMVE